MNLKEYNTLQSEIFKKYKIDCMLINNSVKFYKLCSKISQYRYEELCEDTINKIIKIIEEEDNI